MYDSSTTDLIRSTPQLGDLDRDALPDVFTEAFARLVAVRVRLRAGDAAAEDLGPTRQFSKRLALANEALVALSPDRDDRRSAAFVAGTAYQLIYQIDVLSGIGDQRTSLVETAITADVSAMLLFLIAESSADAAEVSRRVVTTDGGLTGELLHTLVDLAQGRVGPINQRRMPAVDQNVRSATDALFHLILRGVRCLAANLAGQSTTDSPVNLLRQAQMLAGQTGDDHIRTGDPNSDALRRRAISLFPGPYHLASLLLPVANTLLQTATLNVTPPSNIDAVEWKMLLTVFADQRPFLWPNHWDAISKGYLQAGVSSVVGFPTGSGKSAVFQLKIGSVVLAGRKVVFLAPTHALVDQTRRDLQEVFPHAEVLGESAPELGHLDFDLFPDILVMTPESCLVLQYMEPSTFDDVGLLVFDECHLVHPKADTDRRSIDAMLCILNVARLAPDADLLLLSAMMQNTDEMAAWVEELTGRRALNFSMEWKPTRQLRGCIVYDQREVRQLSVLLGKERRQSSTKGVSAEIKRMLGARPYGFFSIKQTWASSDRSDYTYLPLTEDGILLGTNTRWGLTPNAGVLAATLAKDAAQSRIKTLIFSQSIPVAASVAGRVAKSLGRHDAALNAKEMRLLTIAQDEVGRTEQLYVDVEDNILVAGAATHHGLLLREERLLIESLYGRDDGLAVLSATSTLGQGMNMPSQLVIIAEDSRFNEQTGQRELLEARELLNAAGRAGRAGRMATGVVIVIPGKVVGFNDDELKIGPHWARLREIFSRTDQCLVIDDPLTAVLDRVHDAVEPPGDLERYVVSRLCGVGGEGESTDESGDAIRRTLGAFRKRQVGEAAWVEERIASAIDLLERMNVDDPTADIVRRLSSSLGLPEDVLSTLRVDLLDSAPGHDESFEDWLRWMFQWMEERAPQAIRLFREGDLDQQFGSRFLDLKDDNARIRYVIPRLRKALCLWMDGEPLTMIQRRVFGDSGRDVRKSIGARKFVVRMLPTLAHIFSALPMVISEGRQAQEELRDTRPVVFFLGRCVRLGLSSLEMYALYEHLQSDLSRREVHRRFEAVSGYLVSSPNHESWADIMRRMAEALAAQDDGRRRG